MKNLFKYASEHWKALLAIVAILIVQAYCDLSLPAYTSDIVNVGIQQGGVEDHIPDAISAEDMETLLLFTSEKDGKTVLSAYEKDDKTYEEQAYVLKDTVKEDTDRTEKLSGILAAPMMMAAGFESGSDMTADIEEQLKAQLPPEMISEDMTVLDILKMMPQEQKQAFVSEIEKKTEELPDTITEQAAVNYVKEAYADLGIDMDELQFRYLFSTGAKMIGLAVVLIALVVLVLFAVAMPKFKSLQKLVDKVNLVMREILTGLPVIRAFSTEKHEEKRFDKANMDLMKTNLFVNRAMTFMMPIMMLIMNGISVLIMWSGAKGINDGQMQVGDMMAFIQYTMQIIMGFLMICMLSVMLPRAAVAADRVDEVLSSRTVIHDPKTPKKFEEKQKGVLTFDHVSFKYPGADENVLEDITFTAKPGETTAIIGSTGSGKSTLVNLIPRFYDVTDGSIRLDGTDIREVTQHDLRDKLGYVPQKGLLFSGDIASNIMFGNPEGGGQEMKEAAQIAQATEFIEAKPNKYESPISQGGSNVSGGQKQRLSIARAIAKRPEVFIFDDSFSALDFKTDVALRKALKKRTKESTVLIVAQRISTILNAEQIIVLDDGKIAGIGTHKELLRNCEVYKQIAASQLSEKELQDGMQSEDRKTEDIKSETIKTEERKEAISAKTAEQEVRSDV